MIKTINFLRYIEKDYFAHIVHRCICNQLNKQHMRKSYSSKVALDSFKLQHVLIVTKLSRYEFEKLRNPNLDVRQLEKQLRDRGTDYEHLLYMHKLHKNFEREIVDSFQNVGCEVSVYSRAKFRSSLSKEVLSRADIIVPIGGDGTFLLAAGRASPLFAQTQQKIPIVGFNSDPERSAGRLMLRPYYSEHPEEAVRKLKNGDFHWIHRSRVRTTFLGNNDIFPDSSDLYRHTLSKMDQEKAVPEVLDEWMAKKYQSKMKKVLPYLALNEVFIGENLSARVSHLELTIDNENAVNKTKCSGLCVSTGTGSTSWHTSINRITKRHVEDLLHILPNQIDIPSGVDTEAIARQYNENLVFAPDDPRLCYSIREQICVGVWPNPTNFESRKFVKSLFVKSCCIDANLVIDGSIVYPFNDGSKAILEIQPEDALLTIALD